MCLCMGRFGGNMKTMWWGYLHSNGTIQCKRWFGDKKDYQDDCYDNPFVKFVIPPFEAETRDAAMEHLKKMLGENHEI